VFWQNLDLETYHFFSCILDASVPVCAAISFLRSPTVSSGEHLTRTGKEMSVLPQCLCISEDRTFPTQSIVGNHLVSIFSTGSGGLDRKRTSIRAIVTVCGGRQCTVLIRHVWSLFVPPSARSSKTCLHSHSTENYEAYLIFFITPREINLFRPSCRFPHGRLSLLLQGSLSFHYTFSVTQCHCSTVSVPNSFLSEPVCL
jgi:hypothetical protein